MERERERKTNRERQIAYFFSQLFTSRVLSLPLFILLSSSLAGVS
jgi:hypothetical protein